MKIDLVGRDYPLYTCGVTVRLLTLWSSKQVALKHEAPLPLGKG